MKPILEYLYNRKGAIKSISNINGIKLYDIIVCNNENFYIAILLEGEIKLKKFANEYDPHSGLSIPIDRYKYNFPYYEYGNKRYPEFDIKEIWRPEKVRPDLKHPQKTYFDLCTQIIKHDPNIKLIFAR